MRLTVRYVGCNMYVCWKIPTIGIPAVLSLRIVSAVVGPAMCLGLSIELLHVCHEHA